MAKLRSGFFSRLIDVVPIEDTYFIKKDVPDIRLTKEIVRLNYGYLSPFKDGDVMFYKDKKNLYIWFTRRKVEKKRLYLPEGFLVFRNYMSEKEAVIIKNTNKGCGVVILKSGTIAAQFFKKGEADEKFIDFLKKEHSLNTPKIIRINADDVELNMNIQDVSKFLNSFDINFKSILSNLYEEIKVPIIVLLVLINILDVFMYRYVSNEIKTKKTELNKLVKTNETIKEQFSVLEKESNFIKNFVTSEMKYPNLLSILSAITKSVANNNGMITIYRQSANIINLWVVSPSTSSVVNSLIATKYFDNVQVINISQYQKDKTKEMGEISLRIKARK